MIKLDGKVVSAEIYQKIQSDVEYRTENGTIAIITVGDDEASKVYVSSKKKRAEENGFRYQHIHLSTLTGIDMLRELIDYLNRSKYVKGIIIQKPLTAKLRPWEQEIDTLIDPSKDIDGFHPMSEYESCTPKGIITMLNYYNVPYKGKNVVIAGRSDIVAKPLAEMLMRDNCTVTMIHSYTPKGTVRKLIDNCDIFVSAIGKPKYWTPDYFENGHKIALVDVGINRDEENKLCGDVHPDSYEHFDYYTPVPGGVGLMTVASLLDNLNDSCYKED